MYEILTGRGRPFTSKPKTEWDWVNGIFKHEGGYLDFQGRLLEAIKFVDVNKSRRFTLASALMDAIADQRNLYGAYKKLSSKNSCPGPDGVTWSQLAFGLNIKLKKLSSDLKAGDFQPQIERVIPKRKPNGEIRHLILQSTIDRLIDKACSQVLSVALDPSFSPVSFGFRPGRGPWLAIKQMRLIIGQGFSHFVSCDIRNAFGSIPINRLLDLVENRLPDDRLQAFVAARLSCNLVRGLRQGSPLSPVMLNLYLDHFLDKPWCKNFATTPLLRYADDLLAACRSSKLAKSRFDSIVDQLQPTGMRVKESQLDAVFDIREQPVTYLGFQISAKNGIPIVRIAPRGIERLRNAMDGDGRKDGDLNHRLDQWLLYYGPAYKGESRDKIYEVIKSMFTDLGRKGEMHRQKKFDAIWKNKYERYLEKTKKVPV